jgi:hypothetical protein
MPFESAMQELAKEAMAAHGQLMEVILLKDDGDSSVLLVFKDGTVIPSLHQKHGYKIRRESYVFSVARKLSGQDPFEFFKFGYSGTGPRVFSYFLRAAGFQNSDVTKVVAPLKLNRDGRSVRGALQGEDIVWEDGSKITITVSETKKWWQFWKTK